MTIDRRLFLGGLAALPCVFGLRELLAQERDPRPVWLREAFARMQEQRRYGLVLVMPTGRAQFTTGNALHALLESGDSDVRELLASVVLICMTPETATGSVRNAGETVNRILLDPDGKRLAADACPVPVPPQARLFAALHRPFAFGENDERLKQQSDALEKTLNSRTLRALADLDSEDAELRSAATKELLADADRVLPRIAWLRSHAESAEVRVRCQGIVWAHFEKASPRAPGARLPFGCERTVREGEPARRADPCHECGMARLREESVALIRFLIK